MKIRNPFANPDSKTQKKKAEYLKQNPTRFIECEKCRARGVTLYKVGDEYYCAVHKPQKPQSE